MNTSKKKKAFTLTELLVVIVIAGVLAAVALPKFNAVVETRRTGEAEELASAIRNEQERRCALDQSYSVHPNQIGVAGVNTANATFNKGSFEYTLNETGLIARRTDKDYKLVMPSYKDGRMYCEGEYCAKLNKNYPQSLTDLREAEECAAPIGEEGGQTACEQDPNSCECNPNQAKCCKADEYWDGTKCVEDTPCNRDPNSCECNPNQAKCCAEGEVWENGKCVVPQEPEPLECDESSKPEESQVCGNCGTQTRTVTCNTTSGKWETGSWGACGNEGECAAGTTESQSCGENYTGQKTRTCNAQCKWEAWNEDTCGDEMVYKWQDLERATYDMTLQNSVCYGGAVAPNRPGLYDSLRAEVKDAVCQTGNRGRGPHWGNNACADKTCDSAHLGDTCYDCANVSYRCNGLPSGGGGQTRDVTALVMQKKCVYIKKEDANTGSTSGHRGRGG